MARGQDGESAPFRDYISRARCCQNCPVPGSALQLLVWDSGVNQESVLEVLQAGDSRGAWFLRTSRRQDGVLAIVVSGALLYIWTSRLLWDYALPVAGIGVLGGALVVFGVTGQETRIDSSDASTHLVYSRTGVSQNVIIQALLGSALIYSMAYFLVINVVIGSVVPGQIIVTLAIVTTAVLYPILPLLSSLRVVPILKTSVVVHDVGFGTLVIERLVISVLDIAWAGKEHDDGLLLSILDRFHDLITNHAELLISADSGPALVS